MDKIKEFDMQAETRRKIDAINENISKDGRISFTYRGRKIRHFRAVSIKNTNTLNPEFIVMGVFDKPTLYKFNVRFMTDIKEE